jgi:diguanylate cyclase (GGDEF)-like protein
MQLKTKSLLVISIGTLVFTVLFAVGGIYSFKSSYQTDLRLQSQMAGELVRLTITHEMAEGNPQHIQPYLSLIKKVPGFKHAHLVPADSVIKQMEIDTSTFDPAEGLEKEAFTTGKAVDEIIEGETPLFHLAIPYIAQQACLKCHHAQEDDVLGVISIEIDMGQQRQAMLLSLYGMFLLFLLFAMGMAVALRALMSPILETTRAMKHAFGKAEEGDFSVRLERKTSDEIGDIAEHTNHFMQLLESSLGTISREIATLIDTNNHGRDKNILKHTVRVVHNLVSSSHFKQSIENDRDLEEVYGRLGRVLVKQFNIKRFSIYEVSNSKNRLQLITSLGLPEGSDLWCSKEVTIDCNACRARRTAAMVSSIVEDDICSSFSGNKLQQSEKLFHICLPIMLSGSVGGILQLIFTSEEAKEVEENRLTLTSFLAEAAPVIEAKRLMQSLRDASMRDPMTNLYNRRFLEGYLETLTAGVERQKSSIGILMCDVDLFKQVNDTLGHETGDAVLIKVSEILKQSVRSCDLVIRYGGEEFLALLIGADEEKSLEVAERVRTEMEGYAFPTTSGPLKKTISVGASIYPQDTDNFWECVKFADVAMYQAKETGRNKTVRYTKEMWKEEESNS